MTIWALRRHAILVRLTIDAPLAVWAAIATTLAISALVLVHVCRVVRALEVRVVVRIIVRLLLLLLAVRLSLVGLASLLLLSLVRGRIRRGASAVLDFSRG
jgi:hypothetical protein